MKASRRALLASVGAAALAGTTDRPRETKHRDYEFTPVPEPTLGGDSWPAPGDGPRNRYWNPEAAVPSSRPSLVWRTPVEGFTQPVVADGTVLFSVDGGLRALDAGTGAERWHEPIAGERGYVSQPTVSNATVYVGLAHGVRALSLADGSERWQLSFRTLPIENAGVGSATTPVVADGLVFVPAVSGFAAVDGEGTMRHCIRPTDLLQPTGLVPAADGGVFVASNGHETFRFDTDPDPWQDPHDRRRRVPATTAQTWVRSDGDVETGPLVGDGTVYQPLFDTRDGEDGRVVAYDAADGTERWSFEPDAEQPAAALTDRTLFVGDRKGGLYAVDPADGTERWSTSVFDPERRELTLTQPTAGRNGVVATAGGHGVVHYGSDGAERWRLPDAGLGRVVITERGLYVLVSTGEEEYELRCYA